MLGLGVALWEPEMISNAALRLPVKALPQYMSPEQVSPPAIPSLLLMCIYTLFTHTYTHVCVCERERERKRERLPYDCCVCVHVCVRAGVREAERSHCILLLMRRCQGG